MLRWMQKLSGAVRLQFGKASSFRYAFRKYNYEMKDEVYVPMAICSTCTKLIQLSTQNFGTQYPAVVMAMYFNHFFIFYFLFSFATVGGLVSEMIDRCWANPVENLKKSTRRCELIHLYYHVQGDMGGISTVCHQILLILSDACLHITIITIKDHRRKGIIWKRVNLRKVQELGNLTEYSVFRRTLSSVTSKILSQSHWLLRNFKEFECDHWTTYPQESKANFCCDFPDIMEDSNHFFK